MEQGNQQLQNPSNASRTHTMTEEHQEATRETIIRVQPEVIRERHVQFAAEVVDNENMNKKKSKICCIYTKPHNCDDTDTESDASDDDQNRNGYERKPKYKQHKH